MKQKRGKMQGILAVIGLLALIFDSSLALEGARSGLDLCIKTVIPSLFPFFVLSMILTNILTEWDLYPLQMIAEKTGISKTAASVLIPSVLGGYPVGAKCVGDLYQNHQICKNEAERLLAFCSNAGPSFLFGMVSGFFPETKYVWLLWFIHIFSAASTAALIPAVSSDPQDVLANPNKEPANLILSAAKAMGSVCCWVLLFRTIISFLNAWVFWLVPEWVRVLLSGMLELTNGCCELPLIADVRARFVLCSCLLAFGGVCVLFQTAAVTNGLQLGSYLTGKLLQTGFSFLMSCAVVLDKGLLFAAGIPILIMILRKIQNRYRNPRILPV